MWRCRVLAVALAGFQLQEDAKPRRTSRWRCLRGSVGARQPVSSGRSYRAAEGGWRAGRRVALSQGCRAEERLAGHPEGLAVAGGGPCSASQLTEPRVGRHSCPGHLARSSSWASRGSRGPGDAPCSCPCPPPPPQPLQQERREVKEAAPRGLSPPHPSRLLPAPPRRTRGLGTGTPASERPCSGTAPPARSFTASRGRCRRAWCWQQP